MTAAQTPDGSESPPGASGSGGGSGWGGRRPGAGRPKGTANSAGRPTAIERAALVEARWQTAQIAVKARQAALSVLVNAMVEGDRKEKIRAADVVLRMTAGAVGPETELVNRLLLAESMMDEQAGTVDAATPAELVRMRLDAIRARRAPKGGSPVPDPVDASPTATAPGNANLAPVVGMPSLPLRWDRQLTVGPPEDCGPVVIDADPATVPAGVSTIASASVSGDLSASAGVLGAVGPAAPARTSRAKPGAGNALPSSDTLAVLGETDGSTWDHAVDEAGPAAGEPLSVDIVEPVDRVEHVDPVEPVDIPAYARDVRPDVRGEQRREHALPSSVGRRRGPVRDPDTEIVVAAAPGVPPVRRRRTAVEEVAGRRPLLH